MFEGSQGKKFAHQLEPPYKPSVFLFCSGTFINILSLKDPWGSLTFVTAQWRSTDVPTKNIISWCPHNCQGGGVQHLHLVPWRNGKKVPSSLILYLITRHLAELHLPGFIISIVSSADVYPWDQVNNRDSSILFCSFSLTHDAHWYPCINILLIGFLPQLN